jgi:hypothetical protein
MALSRSRLQTIDQTPGCSCIHTRVAHSPPARYAKMSFAMTSMLGSSHQMMPSNRLETMKEEGTMTMRMMVCVHANWENWYMYIPFFKDKTNHTNPAAK